ncbi:MAG: enoyl-CoA hydratase, partial [Chloroflexi bacterium]|nr:enoyl-CoA hydratase [Chloroflexota bacterium]
WLLPRLVGLAKAAEILFTDRTVNSAEAKELGLLNMVVRHERLEAETHALVENIASGPPVALRLARLQLREGLGMDLAAALELAATCEAITLRSEDHGEGVAAFLEKRKPEFKGR